MNNIEELLLRRQEGVLTECEQEELLRLTHRDEVVNAAGVRAMHLRRRRIGRLSGVASLLLVSGLAFTIYSHNTQKGFSTETPFVAQVMEPKSSTETPSMAAKPNEALMDAELARDNATAPLQQKSIAPSEVTKQLTAAPETKADIATPAEDAETPFIEAVAPNAVGNAPATVACNTQCSPDSVINDIWHFLKA